MSMKMRNTLRIICLVCIVISGIIDAVQVGLYACGWPMWDNNVLTSTACIFVDFITFYFIFTREKHSKHFVWYIQFIKILYSVLNIVLHTVGNYPPFSVHMYSKYLVVFCGLELTFNIICFILIVILSYGINWWDNSSTTTIPKT